MNNKLDEYTRITDDALHEFFSNDAIPADLREAMAYSVFAGGKRLRPALLLSACEMCGGDINTALPYAAAIEMIHTYSLIHDDLPALDNDDYRRGKLTSHKMFGEDRAILAGDALLSYAFEIMLKAGNLNASRYIAEAAGSSRMVAGQWVDVTLNGNVFDTKTMEYIHLNKTAAMIKGALLAGGACAGADDETLDILDKFGTEIGYTFQIIDDILDVNGDEKELGKAVGSDKAKNKTTYVTLYGIDGAKVEARRHTENAVELMSAFGEKGNFLSSLAQSLLVRTK